MVEWDRESKFMGIPTALRMVVGTPVSQASLLGLGGGKGRCDPGQKAGQVLTSGELRGECSDRGCREMVHRRQARLLKEQESEAGGLSTSGPGTPSLMEPVSCLPRWP